MTTVRERVYVIGLKKGLRENTITSYTRLLSYAGLLDKQADSLTLADVTEAIWSIDNPNTRRATVIAIRSVLGFKIKIPKAIPRRYELPSEEDLRLALMLTPHETRCLAMMYAGLRIGEACAISRHDIHGDRLTIAKQVIEVFQTGTTTRRRQAPVKATEGTVIVPHWLAERIEALEGWEYPASVRESLRRAGNKLGLKLNPHMLRHWYATESLKRGMPLPLLSKQLRHSDVAVTLRAYIDFNEADIHDIWK